MQRLYGNTPATVHVFLDSGTEVRAATWNVHYDPAVLVAETSSFTPGFTNAVCNATGQPGAVRMSLLSVDPLPATMDVAAITFRRHPEAKRGSKSGLTFDVTNFADLAGDLLPYRSVSGEIQLFDPLGVPPAVTLELQGAPNGGFNLPHGSSLELPIRLDIDPQQPLGSLTGKFSTDPAVVRPHALHPGSVRRRRLPDGILQCPIRSAGGDHPFHAAVRKRDVRHADAIHSDVRGSFGRL